MNLATRPLLKRAGGKRRLLSHLRPTQADLQRSPDRHAEQEVAEIALGNQMPESRVGSGSAQAVRRLEPGVWSRRFIRRLQRRSGA